MRTSYVGQPVPKLDNEVEDLPVLNLRTNGEVDDCSTRACLCSPSEARPNGEETFHVITKLIENKLTKPDRYSVSCAKLKST